ncbi:Outer membrane efflux protein [Bartonella choladocola]|uniref:Outer membrane protein TolC n=2 Tax=Bartonellaceae TaxID=772 RepID=A0A1U9MJU5_9HYPH|nr:Outer membrane protein TolC [Bartonella choladocola]
MTKSRLTGIIFILSLGMTIPYVHADDLIPIERVPIPIFKPQISPAAAQSSQGSLSRNNVPATSQATTNENQQVEMTVADVVFLSIRNNRTIKSSYINRISQKFDLRVAEDRFTPQFSIDGSLSRQRIAGVHTNLYDISPGVNMITPLGTTFDFAWNVSGSSSDNYNTLDNNIDMSISQPLLRGAGVTVNMAPVNVARLQEKINKLHLKTTVSETIGQAILAHRDLLQAQEELRLANEAVIRGQETLQQNRSLIAAGRMAEVDAVQTEADLENQKLRVLQAQQTIEDRRLNLLDILNLDLSTPLVAKEEFKLKKIPIDLRKLFDTALLNREDYQSQLYVIDQNKLNVKVAENQQLWDISLFAQGTYGTQKQTDLPDTRTRNGKVGIQLSIPLNDLTIKQQLVQADTTTRTSELQLDIIKSGIERQIRTSATEVKIYWQQAKTAQTSLDLARRALEVEKTKLNAGRSSTFEVRSMEQNLRDAETQLVNARINYLNALTRLDLQLGTTLETWQVSLND